MSDAEQIAFCKLSERPPRPEADVARARSLFAKVLRPMRLRARELGYALGLHGSASRDLDLIAAPWREGAIAPFDLAFAMRDVVNEVLGIAAPMGFSLSTAPRPHGREAWSIHLVEEIETDETGWTCSPYIDLSIMPRTEDAPIPSIW
jgi:hypothetical protein